MVDEGQGEPRIVYVVDGDRGFRTATSFLLRTHGYRSHPFMAASDFLESVSDLKPGCLLLEVNMPEMDGIALLAEIKARGIALPSIAMSAHGDIATAVRAMKLGAIDFLEKPLGEPVLVAALTQAFAALRPHGGPAEEARRAFAELPARQLSVVRGLVAGLSNKEIAHRLDVAPRTVEMHRANMMRSLGVRNLPEVLRLALEAGIAPLTQAGAPD